MRTGRPKMTREQHLTPRPREKRSKSLTFPEVKEIFIQVFETLGENEAKNILKMFHVEKLSDLGPKEWPRVVRLCREKLL